MSKRFSEARIKRIAKEIADLWDNHCECPSKDFNREALLEQVITNALLDERPAPAGEPQPQAPKVICDIEKKPHERDAVTKCRNPRPAPEGPEERK